MGNGTGRVVAIARRERTRAPMEVLDSAEVSVEAGVAGDARGALRGRQVTVMTQESWAAACSELGKELPWTIRRANILVEGLQLADSEGQTIYIGGKDDGLELLVTGETDPCSRMEEQQEGLRAALTPDWRGGVTCRVVRGGAVRVGDAAQVA